MPKLEPGSDDPMALTGVELPASQGDVVEMARAFAEEFAFAGWDEARLLRLFQEPFYAGPHMAWTQLGEESVRSLIADALRPWRNDDA